MSSSAAAAADAPAVGQKRPRADDGNDVVRLALSPMGPPQHMDAALDTLFGCLARFLLEEPSPSSPATSTSPPLEVVVVDEAAGQYAEALQTRTAALPASSSSTTRAVRLHLGDITELYDAGPPACHVLACACDRRFMPSADHPASHGVFRAAGPQLASTAKLLFHRAEPGRAYAIKLPATSPLRTRQGAQFVILALPPDGGDDDEGWIEALRATYDAVLACFVREVASKVQHTPATAPATAAASPRDDGKKAKGAAAEGGATSISAAAVPPDESPAVPGYRHPGPPPASMGWQGGLHQYLQRAATNDAVRAFVFLETERYMVVYDGYPKARVHLLLMPKPAFLAVNTVTDLRREHLERLVFLHNEARRIRVKLQGDMTATSAGRAPPEIRLGYHSLPSLHPLHLHVVSQDFDAAGLKTKKHWNSFTSAFFLDAEAVEAALREDGRLVVDKPLAEALLKQPLRCHACGAGQANMPALKRHLTQCRRLV